MTTDKTGTTIGVAVAVGAGVVAGAGALAAWLFKPVPGGVDVPAPSSPPPYSTDVQPITSDEPSPSTSSTPSTLLSSTSSTEPYACPFENIKVDAKRAFTSPPVPVKWTLGPPQQTISSMKPACTQQGNNKQLLRGADPGYVKALARVFCKMNLSKDQSKTLGQKDLPDGDMYKNKKLDGIQVNFDFKFALKNDNCPQNCVDSYGRMVTECQYNSHSIYGGDSLQQGCGSYSYMIDAEPNLKTDCHPPNPRGVEWDYQYREAALDSINDFCKAQDGRIVKQHDLGSFINEVSFSVTYADTCQGSGEYKITKGLCTSYLGQTVDGCDTGSVTYKHGGILIDTDNCGTFAFHPPYNDSFACWPRNQPFITGDSSQHVPISTAVAQDAINAFCDDDGKKQHFKLKPNKPGPDLNDFVQNTCASKGGGAQCAYFYTNDGKRITKRGDLGDFSVRVSAKFWRPSDSLCSSDKEYEIRGERCKVNLQKLMGINSKESCAGSDPNKLDLGSLHEGSEKGCVLWSMWAVRTR